MWISLNLLLFVEVKHSSESPGKNTLASFPSRLTFDNLDTSYRVEMEMSDEDCGSSAIATVMMGCRYFDQTGKVSKCSVTFEKGRPKDVAHVAHVNHYKSSRTESKQCFYDLDISDAVRCVAMQATTHRQLLFDLELRLTIQVSSLHPVEKREFAFLVCCCSMVCVALIRSW